MIYKAKQPTPDAKKDFILTIANVTDDDEGKYNVSGSVTRTTPVTFPRLFFYPVERNRYCFLYKISLLASPNFTTH